MILLGTLAFVVGVLAFMKFVAEPLMWWWDRHFNRDTKRILAAQAEVARLARIRRDLDDQLMRESHPDTDQPG